MRSKEAGAYGEGGGDGKFGEDKQLDEVDKGKALFVKIPRKEERKFILQQLSSNDLCVLEKPLTDKQKTKLAEKKKRAEEKRRLSVGSSASKNSDGGSDAATSAMTDASDLAAMEDFIKEMELQDHVLTGVDNASTMTPGSDGGLSRSGSAATSAL